MGIMLGETRISLAAIGLSSLALLSLLHLSLWFTHSHPLASTELEVSSEVSGLLQETAAVNFTELLEFSPPVEDEELPDFTPSSSLQVLGSTRLDLMQGQRESHKDAVDRLLRLPSEGCPSYGDFNGTTIQLLDAEWQQRTNRLSVAYRTASTPFENGGIDVPGVVYQSMSVTDRTNKEEALIAFFRDAYVVGARVCVFDCSVLYQQGGCHHGCKFPDVFENYHEPPIQLDRAILIHNWNGGSLYHFLVECVPRLFVVPKDILQDPTMKIIINYNKNYKFLFDLLGIQKNRIAEMPKDRVTGLRSNTSYHVQQLLVPSPSGCGRPILPGLKRATTYMRKHLGEVLPRYPDWLATENQVCVLLREPGAQRAIANFEEMIDALQAAFPMLSFSVYRYDDNGETMVERFASASYFIGAHGAGLSNLLFARPDVKVLEIFPKGLANDCLEHFIRQLDYSYLSMESVEDECLNWKKTTRDCPFHKRTNLVIGTAEIVERFSNLTGIESVGSARKPQSGAHISAALKSSGENTPDSD